MKNRKQLLADFYLNLLALPNDIWRAKHQGLYALIANQLAIELESDPETVQNIFERMASEDVPKPKVNPYYCIRCDKDFTSISDYVSHNCFREDMK